MIFVQDINLKLNFKTSFYLYKYTVFRFFFYPFIVSVQPLQQESSWLMENIQRTIIWKKYIVEIQN